MKDSIEQLLKPGTLLRLNREDGASKYFVVHKVKDEWMKFYSFQKGELTSWYPVDAFHADFIEERWTRMHPMQKTFMLEEYKRHVGGTVDPIHKSKSKFGLKID